MKLPTPYATGCGTYVVQGWKVDDAEALAKMTIPAREGAGEIPRALFRFVPRQD